MTSPPSFPNLKQGEYAVVCADSATGIVLSLDGRYATGDMERYRVFATLEPARRCAADLAAANPSWEAAVLDADGGVIATYSNTPPEPGPERKRPPARWWKRWFGP